MSMLMLLDDAVANFIPASLSIFAGGALGDHWRVGDRSTLYQLTTDAAPNVNANLDPVGKWIGSVNGNQLLQASSPAKPWYDAATNSVLFINSSTLKTLTYTIASQWPVGTPITILMTTRAGIPSGTAEEYRQMVSVGNFNGDYTGALLQPHSGVQESAIANTNFLNSAGKLFGNTAIESDVSRATAVIKTAAGGMRNLSINGNLITVNPGEPAGNPSNMAVDQLIKVWGASQGAFDSQYDWYIKDLVVIGKHLSQSEIKLYAKYAAGI